MGLGPPVCQHCQVIGTLDLASPNGWYCAICGETDLKDWAGIGNDHSQYRENEKFLKFMKGEKLAPR